jgi:hypothetical protein
VHAAAKWWTQADVPASGLGASPWTLVGKVTDERPAGTVKKAARAPTVPKVKHRRSS